MTSSDDEYLAPVINLFGDRSGAKLTEAMDSSLEESAAAETGVAANTTADDNTADDNTEAGMPVVALAPVRALPTLADFSPSHSDLGSLENDEHSREPAARDTVDSAESMSAAGSAGTQSKAQRRQARDGFSEVSRVSMRALARRGMSSYEMTQFLGTREFESEDIDNEIARLEGCGLLDDAALAETLTRTLRDRKKLGASAIRAELRRRKIDQDQIAAVLDDDRDEEQERATEIALKRAPQLRSLDGVTAKRRLTGFLMRKGYSGSVVSAAVAAALAPSSSNSSGGPVFR
ncbi:regulatory protein RecX [Salinibacterium sp. M195]|uniref:regulatory protein RecX n=1 Tax=Salinibacterium sp. M195 TaxID=2583374 RepID=UPI001C62B3B6|nr:regulatory protein RecX [Salinibacterium sp. M195]QYH36447.1 regulatory protein RecX [Salinibacterium sp. M195]